MSCERADRALRRQKEKFEEECRARKAKEEEEEKEEGEKKEEAEKKKKEERKAKQDREIEREERWMARWGPEGTWAKAQKADNDERAILNLRRRNLDFQAAVKVGKHIMHLIVTLFVPCT